MNKKKVARIPNVVNGVSLIQPNRVTNTSFKGFTLMMHRIFTAIQLELQDAIQHGINNNDIRQLELFSDSSNDILVKVAYKSIIEDKTQYRDVRKALGGMASLAAEIPYIDPVTGKSMLRITGLLKADVPENADFNSEILIRIDKKMAMLLIEIDKNATGGPINFTKFSYQVAQSATCLHTPPLYKILSGWKSKEFYKVRYSELRNYLGIAEGQYKRFGDFKKRVLLPVWIDLKNVSDVWFSYEHKNFKTVEKGETWLLFKIITKERQKITDMHTENIRFVLTNYGLNVSKNADLEIILNDESIPRDYLLMKIMEVEDFIYKNNSDTSKEPIKNKQAYMLSSLKKAFLEGKEETE